MLRFLKDRDGNFALMTVIAMIPIMGGLALAIDYSQMTKQRQETLNALDAAGIATARYILQGGGAESEDYDADVKAYAKNFFEANLASVQPSNTTLTVILPTTNTGGGTLKLTAALKYAPYFYPTFAALIDKDTGGGDNKLDFDATAEIQLKNTLEVALVLDNSGSMDYTGTGSSMKRMDLLKDAAKELVTTLSEQAGAMAQVSKPLQFAVVPFAASVNVGASNKTKTWMDLNGLSPIHHENFTYPNTASQYTQIVNGMTYARGTGWNSTQTGTYGVLTLKDTVLTRFKLYDTILRRRNNTTNPPTYTYTSWEGCVESRPYPYNVNDATPTTATPATLFVPMYAPDEVGNIYTKQSDGYTIKTFNAYNSWWDDKSTSTSTTVANQLIRQKVFTKYLYVLPKANSLPAAHSGPNASCTTAAIAPLTDVSTTAGVDAVKASIDAMISLGATNVPEGMAWGWRVVSGGEPFTEGRPDVEKGNDKVLIVLTDGANTYYTPESLGYSDPSGNKSIYSNFGYTSVKYAGGDTRLFLNTSSDINKTDYSNDNYTAAMNEHFTKLCDNAKTAGLIVMTVSLDLSASKTTEKAQMDALEACSSESRFSAGVKLYWNATGGDLSDTFKKIADELSNLRIVG